MEQSLSELNSDLETTQSELKIAQEEALRWKNKYEREKEQSLHTMSEYNDIRNRMDDTHQREIADSHKLILQVK